MKTPKEFEIPAPEFPDGGPAVESVVKSDDGALDASQGPANPSPQVIKALAELATNAWKARTKMIDHATGEVRDEMKRVHRHIEGMLTTLQDLEIEVKDYTGDAFDYGLPLKVITTQPTAGLSREQVVETIKPTIIWKGQIVQMGEVVIATPTSTEKQS